MFWGPKIASEATSQHQIQKDFPGGACLQTPLASSYTLTLPLGNLYRYGGPMLFITTGSILLRGDTWLEVALLVWYGHLLISAWESIKALQTMKVCGDVPQEIS